MTVIAVAALVCHGGPSASYQAEWTYWDSIQQAREAEAELTPCGPSCIEVHSCVLVDVGAPPRPRRSAGLRSPWQTKS